MFCCVKRWFIWNIFFVYNFLLFPIFKHSNCELFGKNWNWSFDVIKEFVCDVNKLIGEKKKRRQYQQQRTEKAEDIKLLFVCHSDQLKSRFCKNAQQIVITTITTTTSTVNSNTHKKKISRIFNILNQVCKRFNYRNIYYIVVER